MHLFLILHIVGALTTFIFVCVTVFSLITKREMLFRPLMKILAGNGIYQVVTGSLVLAQGNNSSTVLGFCVRLGLYLAVVLFFEGLLFLKLRAQPSKAIKINS